MMKHTLVLAATSLAVLAGWLLAAETPKAARGTGHWAFVAPVKPPAPSVQEGSWVANPIDAFVSSRLQAAGLKPAPRADKLTLIRRVYLDLIGIPPTPEQARAFAEDPSPDAYEKAVDTLLQNPAYGERWARLWLDLARFADTKGYEKDWRRPGIWRYRDWVIVAFNADMPYPQFTAEQLGGDLIPNATPDQILATAFHRTTMSNDEGGTDDEEFRLIAVKDRVDTTMQVWMGLTMGCAQCHTHKYDPIANKEYYQFLAVFNQTEDADRFDDHPLQALPSKAHAAQIEAHNAPLNAKIAELTAKINADDATLDAAQAEWEAKPESLHKPPEPVAKLLAVPADQRNEEQKKQIKAHFRSVAPQLATARREIEESRKQLLTPPMVPIMRELPADKQRVTNIHIGGNFLDKGPVVRPGLPAAFHAWPEGKPLNRLTLADWLVSRDNPLTARVAVNRWWAQFFGRGLVETEEDFGTQGTAPSHPELLDWLAVEFMDNGWSFKKLCKTIVMSATYRQDSSVTPDKLAQDPRNTLLSRGPRFRMEAEMVRDNALAVASLLSGKMYGPSVMPAQPDGLWAAVYSDDKWLTSPGEDKYRRGLYTFIKRTTPYPTGITFDGPSREICTIRRIRTNTPLQALVTLNDPVYIEAAQALARRMVKDGGDQLESRLAYGLQRALIRPAQPDEMSELAALYHRRLEEFKATPSEAVTFATDPLGPLPQGWNAAELAALTAVCNVILNLDEALNKN